MLNKLRQFFMITILTILLLSIWGIESVFASSNIIRVTNATVYEESSSASGNVLDYQDNKITSKTSYHKPNDYITYKVTIKNMDTEKHIVDLIVDNNKVDYLEYDYDEYRNTILEPKEEVDIYIKEIYREPRTNQENPSITNSVRFTFKLIDDEKNESIIKELINPKTGGKIYKKCFIFIIILLLILLLLLILKKYNKEKEAKTLAFILIPLLFLTIPITRALSSSESILLENNINVLEKLNITFNSSGNTTSETITYGSKVKEPISPKIEGYEFIGWYVGDNKYDFNKAVTTNLDLTAKFKKLSHTITYHLDGSNANNPSTYQISSLPITLNNPEKKGYVFSGWIGSNGDIPQRGLIITDKEEDLEYTAVFEEIEYSIKYYGLSASVIEALDNPTTYKITDSVTLNNPSDRLDSEGEIADKFIGWRDSTGNLSMEISYSNETGNKTYEAIWQSIKPDTHTITYILHDGVVDGENPTEFTNSTSSFYLINPTKTGYEFLGWIGSNGEVPQKQVLIEKGTVDNLEFEAIFELIEYDLSYILDEGEAENLDHYNYEQTITLNNPTKTGYEFTGWLGTNVDSLNTNVTIPIHSTGNRNYTAYYEIIHYNINYVLNGGDVEGNPNNYTINDTVSLNNPTKTGYEFTGWTGTGLENASLDVSFSNQTGNRNYTANFTANTYTVQFDKNDSAATGEMNPQTFTYDEAQYLTNNSFSKNGYMFDGWTTNPDGSGTGYTDGESVSNLLTSGTITLYAKWKNVKVATFITGSELNSKMNTLAGNINNILKFKYVSNLTEENKTSGTVVSVSNQSDEPIYMWWDSNTKTIYYGSDADIIYLNKTCSYMFNNLKNVTEIDTDFDTSNCTNMQQMFYMNNKLATIRLSNFNTSKVENMVSMFGHNYTAHNYDINNWDVTKVTKFTNMFIESSGITTLDLSNWHTDSATIMEKMFANVNQATSIKVDNFNTSKATNMQKMFCDTKKLKSLDLSNFDTSKATSMVQFVQNTYELESITFGPLFTIQNAKSVSKMFENTGLTTVDISMFNTANVNTFNNMFDGAKLETIIVGPGFVTTGQTSNPIMFNEATNLVGERGTTYSNKTKLYARVDNPDIGEPGYFTAK